MLGIRSPSRTFERRTGNALLVPARTKSLFWVFAHPIPIRSNPAAIVLDVDMD